VTLNAALKGRSSTAKQFARCGRDFDARLRRRAQDLNFASLKMTVLNHR
jgi:hypothetical protein